MPGSSDSVKVAVRVRPFNQRERNAGSKCIISMKDTTTIITNPDNGDTKSFSFDHSYWSHDGFTENDEGVYESSSSSSNYADQQSVFRDLGQGVLDNAWQGYNAALFAYGQTGSGKSYSMIGYGPNKGIVPITCEELFKVIDSKADEKKQSRVFFSMLEIYNEQVRDLLVKAKPPHGGLKIRQNPKLGFYVEGLKQVPVRSYKEIEKLMESGTINRTTASTNMNATSSRSHMVITIRFEQVLVSTTGQSNTRSSDINLVDLAGSERADSTGAVGDRLKEGSAINQSLSTLGNVISALADQAMGKKKVLVPYRDSVLTKLLQSALGGNSRTIMIAALSPANINYDETLSTLRYADRAKKIQNKAVINESPTDRLIRELKEENARLMAMLKKQGKGDTTVLLYVRPAPRKRMLSNLFTNLVTTAWDKLQLRDIQRMLEDNQKRMSDMQMTWEQRLEEARKEWEKSHAFEKRDQDERWADYPYMTNVNEDPQLSWVIKHVLCRECTSIGRTGTGEAGIELRGLGIQPKHAEIITDGTSTFIKPDSESSLVLVNGIKVREKTALKHLDRLKFGSGSLFLYIGYPRDRSSSEIASEYNYDYFMSEIAEHEGVSVDISTPRPGDIHHEDDVSSRVLFQEFVDIMPNIAEANAISEELKRFTKFEAIIKSASSHDPKGTDPTKDVLVKVTNTKSKKVWMWSRSKFYNRKDLMDELYLKFMDGDKQILTRDKDPFWDPVEDIYLGSCHILLQSITYGAELDEHFTFHNYHGKEEAVVQVQMLVCNDKGQIIEEGTIQDPNDLINKSFSFVFAIPHCMSVRWVSEDQSRGVECRFTLPFQKPLKTDAVWHKSYVEFGFKQHVKYKKFTKDMLIFFEENSLVLELWGKQVSEDEQLHQHNVLNGESAKNNKTDVLTLLKLREEEVERLHEDYDELKRDNFRLRQSQMKAEDKIKLMEMRGALKRQNSKDRRGSISNDRRGSISNERRGSISTELTQPQQGIDVEFAKTLREFFKEIKDVQHSLSDMYDFVADTKAKTPVNGIHKSLDEHGKMIEATNDKLVESLQKLKKGAAASLRKGRPATEK